MEDDKEKLIYWFGNLIKNEKDRLIDIILDEKHLEKILRRYLEGYEILFIPKNQGK